MTERMSDERLAEIEGRGWVNQHHEELLQALKAERGLVEQKDMQLAAVRALADKWRKSFDYESESGEPLDAIKRGVNKCADELDAILENSDD